jgi:hypothetical protein
MAPFAEDKRCKSLAQWHPMEEAIFFGDFLFHYHCVSLGGMFQREINLKVLTTCLGNGFTGMSDIHSVSYYLSF